MPFAFTAAVFDVDGVLVASPHERAWREVLAEFLASRAGEDHARAFRPERFTTAIYQDRVAGKTRLEGARAVLEWLGVPDATARAAEYARRKQQRLEDLIEAGEYVAFPDALRLVRGLRARGLRLAAASSSKNATRLMERVSLDGFPAVEQGNRPRQTLLDAFAANVSGRHVARGKPYPDLFLLAAAELGVPTSSCIAIEDAPSGVRAAKAAGMAAIGVARVGDEALLRASGADLVVTTLDDVDVEALVSGRLAPTVRPATSVKEGREGEVAERFAAAMQPPVDARWLLRQSGYSPLGEPGIESRFAISNGFLGVRGSRAISRGPMWMSFVHTLSWASWPRTFVAGLFDTPETEPAVPALAPAPDWLRIRVMLDGRTLLLRSGELLAHARTLDLERGVMVTEWHQRDAQGCVIRLRSLRMVSMADRAIGMQLVQLRLEGGPADVTFETTLELGTTGLELVRTDPGVAVWRTSTSEKVLAMASAAELRVDGDVVPSVRDTQLEREWRFACPSGQVASFWRLVSIVRGDDERDPVQAVARDRLVRAVRTGWPGVLAAHVGAWTERWRHSDIAIDGDAEAERALRFAIYHLNSAANPDDEHVSIGARALTGDAYLGHVFWDTEIYLLPFYVLTWPEAARALLMYRYHTLSGARAKAARVGYRGALYAWESADTGDEATPDQIVDSDGRIIQVRSGTLEQHISADIAHAVWQYWQATGDDEFLFDAGAEILVETARFWATRATLECDGAYHIRNVIGPDEYHEGVDDNAFTNVMARSNLSRAHDVVRFLGDRCPDRWSALARRLRLENQELGCWRDVATRLVTGFDPKTGLYEQFFGYFGLEDIDLRQYAGRAVPMDVVLGRERAQRSRVVKQADVVALMALLPDEFSPQVRDTNFRYYESRCSHGSSLSRSMHAIIAARLGDVAMAERYFRETAATDLSDTRTGSAGGVRIAALGGLWQAAMFGFIGLSLRPDGMALDPHLPASWRAVTFAAQWRGRRVRVRLEAATRTCAAILEQGEPMVLHVGGQWTAAAGSNGTSDSIRLVAGG